MKVYVVPTLTGHQVIKEGHRRGLEYTTAAGASRVARRMVREAGGGRVLFMNDVGKVKREVRLDGT